MEFRSENLETQVSLSSRQTPNQQTCIANEDIAIASEISVERPDVVEVEKTMVIQKKFIINEKFVVPKATMSFPNQILYGNQALFIDSNASAFFCDARFPDSQGSGKMEIASQESLDSRMDISSQNSHLSLMEYSSQETDVTTVSDVCIPSSPRVNPPKPICHAQSSKGDCAIAHRPDVVPKEVHFSQQIPTSEEQEDEYPNDEEDLLKTGDGITTIYTQDYGDYEVDPVNEIGYFKHQDATEEYQDRGFSAKKSLLSGERAVGQGITTINTQDYENYDVDPVNEKDYFEHQDATEEYHDQRFSAEKSLLSRERAVAAREAACMSREKAIEERESSIESKLTRSRDVAESEVRSPKRLKLIGVFEYS